MTEPEWGQIPADGSRSWPEDLRQPETARGLCGGSGGLRPCGGGLPVFPRSPGAPASLFLSDADGVLLSGMRGGKASYALLHGRFLEAFCWNPLMVVILPLLLLYLGARVLDG